MLHLGEMYCGVKIKVLNPAIYPKMTHKDDIPQKVFSSLKWNKHGIIDHIKLRERFLIYESDPEIIKSQVNQDLYKDVRYLLLNDVQIHPIRQDNGRVLLVLVQYGPLLRNEGNALQYKSVLDVYDDLSEYSIRLTTDGRISFVVDNNPQALDMSDEDIMSIFTEVFDHRLRDGGLMSNDKTGGLIARNDDQEFRAENEDIVLISPPKEGLDYMRSFVNNAIIPYNRAIIVGGKRPEGFTEFNINNSGYDLVRLIEDAETSDWVPVLRLIEVVYDIYKFSTHFQELWSLFNESVSDEQRDLIDFQFLLNRINDLEVNMIASIEDYKKQAIQMGFAMFNTKIMKGDGQSMPNRLWMPITNNKETLVTLAYLLAYNNYISTPYELIMVNDTRFSAFMTQDNIKDQLRLVSDACRIYTTMQPELWNDVTRVFIRPNPQNLFHLSRFTPEVSVLSGNHLILPSGEPIPGIQYNIEFANWNIKEMETTIIKEYTSNETKELEEEEEEEEIPQETEEPSVVDIESLYEEFFEEVGVRDYVYRANQSTPTIDHKTRLKIIEAMSNSFEVLLTIKYTMGSQLNLRELDERLQQTVVDLFDNALISKIQVSTDDYVLGVQEKGEQFINRTKNTMTDRSISTDRIKHYMDHMSEIREHSETRGAQSYLRTLVGFAELIGIYYFRRQNRIDHLSAAILQTWDDSVLDHPDNFNKIFFATYYSRIQELYRDADIMEEQKEVNLDRIPTATDEVVSIKEDPLEEMDHITVRKRKKASSYVKKEAKADTKVADKVEETDWVKKYDTPTADKVTITEGSTEKIPSQMVDEYVIIGDADEISFENVEKFELDTIELATRARNLLADEGISKIGELREYNKPFLSINGVGEKLNDELSSLRKRLRAIRSADEYRDLLSEKGKRQFVKQGGEIDDMDPNYLRRINANEMEEVKAVIESNDTPTELVRGVISWILEKLNREVSEDLGELMNGLGLAQEISNPLRLRDGKLVKLGFPYVYKKQDEFEDSIDYKHVIRELKEKVTERMETLVFPAVQTAMKSAGDIKDRFDNMQVSTEEKTSFNTAVSVMSADKKSAFTLFHSSFEGYMRRICDEKEITPEVDGRNVHLLDLVRVVNKRYQLKLPIKEFAGEIKEIRNSLSHGISIDTRRIEIGLEELIDYILLSIERINKI